MVWVRLDDHFDENPKIAAVGPLGLALWTVGLAYCNRNLTDGFIPFNVANGLLSWEYLDPQDGTGRRKRWRVSVSSGMVGDDVSSERVIDLLVYAGLWEWDDERGGYYIHDYDHFQPTKADVEAERLAKQAAGRAGGQASALARAQAKAEATAQPLAQAKSKPVPVPVPTASKEAVEGASGPHSRRRAISEADVTRWEGEHPTVDIDAMVKDYLNWTGSSKHTDKVLGFENQLREAWRLEKFRKQAPTVGQNVMDIHKRNKELERIAWERKNPGIPFEVPS